MIRELKSIDKVDPLVPGNWNFHFTKDMIKQVTGSEEYVG